MEKLTEQEERIVQRMYNQGLQPWLTETVLRLVEMPDKERAKERIEKRLEALYQPY